MSETGAEFRAARRVSTSLLVGIERTALIWLARRVPLRVNSDHLTALGAVAMLGAGACYALARLTPLALLGVVACLAANWLGDSLDGTLARVRHQERPRYGFYVDHVLDAIGTLFLLAGLAASGYMSPLVALSLLVAYLLLSVDVYLATHCLATFRLSFWKFGPTELRIVLAVGTLALLRHPTTDLLGWPCRLFDIGGVVATILIVAVLVTSVVRNTVALYRAEPLSPASVR